MLHVLCYKIHVLQGFQLLVRVCPNSKQSYQPFLQEVFQYR